MKKMAVPILIGIIVSGCSKSPPASATAAGVTPTTTVSTYHHDLSDVAQLVAAYVRHWEHNGEWPTAGTFETPNLIYKDSEASFPGFPGRRRDFYRTLHEGGRELDVILWSDGRIEVKTFSE